MKVALYAQNCAPSTETYAVAKLLVGALKNTMNGIEINASRETQLRIYSEPPRADENVALRVQLGFMQSDEFLCSEQIELIRDKVYAIEGLQVLPLHHRFTAYGAQFHFVEFFALLPSKLKKPARAKKGEGDE